MDRAPDAWRWGSGIVTLGIAIVLTFGALSLALLLPVLH